MRFFYFLLFISFGIAPSFAQQLTGVVIDEFNGDTLRGVGIENLTSHHNAHYFGLNVFSIQAQQNDLVRFSLLGYESLTITMFTNTAIQYRNISLKRSIVALDTVVISGQSDYQKDSLVRRALYGRKVDEKPATFRMKKKDTLYGSTGPGEGTLRFEAPLSSIIQKRTSRYKRLQAFQDRFNRDESQLFIDTRYRINLVTELTGLTNDSLALFMDSYPMAVDFARAATELEIKMWVKFNYRNWIKKEPAIQEEQ